MHTPHCAEYGRCVSLWRSFARRGAPSSPCAAGTFNGGTPVGSVSAPDGGTETPTPCPQGRYVGRPVLELASSRVPSASASAGAASACTDVPAGRPTCPPCRRSGA
eukprot:3991307-Heterocapsa_arctica.AAC.1